MSDQVAEARRLYQEAIDALSEQRDQIEEDLRFSDPSKPEQWDEAEKMRRLGDPGGARPCLVFDRTHQYIANVAGQFEQRPPGLHAMPVDNGGDKKVAEQLDGWFRHIEHQSRAAQHYARANYSAARAGVGYLTLKPEYTDRSLGYQEPRIGSEGDPLRVVFDPWSIELDGSDASFAYHLTPFSLREFKRRWPKADAVSFAEMEVIGDDRQSVQVVEQWSMVEKSINCVIFTDANGDEVSLPEDQYWEAYQRGQVFQVNGQYKDKKRAVYWRRMSGAEVLDKMTDREGKEAAFPADNIGIIPVYGYVGFQDGRMRYCGIPRRARAAQQAYNFHKSEERAYILTAPKAPWVGPAEAFAPYKTLWDRANIEQRAYLPFAHLDGSGSPIPAPQRSTPTINLANHIQGAQEALRDLEASIGMYQANLGAPSNETSGVAIESRKQQGEASTAHFLTHAQAAIAHVGRMIMQMVPRLIDTRRQLRTLGFDGSAGIFTADPDQAQPVQETPRGLSINPNVGRYDVRVSVGAAYNTQRSQAAEAFNEVMARNPAMAPIIAPFWAQVQDFPQSDKLAQVMLAMAPEPVKAVLAPEKQGPTTEQLIGQVEQLQQQLQQAVQLAEQAGQAAQQATAEAESAKAEAAAKQAEIALKADETRIKAYDAETKRAQVLGLGEQQVRALVVQTIQQLMNNPDPVQPAEPESYEMQPMPANLEGEQWPQAI